MGWQRMARSWCMRNTGGRFCRQDGSGLANAYVEGIAAARSKRYEQHFRQTQTFVGEDVVCSKLRYDGHIGGGSALSVGSYVAEFANGTTEYLFQSLPVGHSLRGEIESHFPAWAGPSFPDERQVQLAIGPKHSGAPPHYHKAAINTLFYGHKKWYLFPPKDSIYSSTPSAKWVEKGPAESRQAGRTIYECDQRPGEILFIPDFWGHATLNLEPSVAVASEFISPRMEFEITR
jgi:hypothetical protein